MLSWEDYHKEETTPVNSAALSLSTEPEELAEPAMLSSLLHQRKGATPKTL